MCGSRELSNFFLCEVNQLLTGHVKFIKAIDTNGRAGAVPFTSGKFRNDPTHVLTRDGTVHMYVEAWQIHAEMQDLVEYCNELLSHTTIWCAFTPSRMEMEEAHAS